MTGFRFFSLRRLNGRIFWAFVFLACLMLATGIGTSFILSDAKRTNEIQIRRTNQGAATKIFSSLVEQQNQIVDETRQFNTIQGVHYLNLIRVNAAPKIDDLAREFPAGDETEPRFREVYRDYKQLDKVIEDAIQRVPPPTVAEIQEIYRNLRSSFDNLQLKAGSLQRDQEEKARTASSQYQSFVNNTGTTYLLVSVGLFILAIIFAALIARVISEPLQVLANSLRRIAVGNLTEPMPSKGPDEIVELSLIFNRTLANLKDAIARTQEQAAAVGATSHQITTSSDAQVTSLSEQAVALSQVSATVAELSDTSQNIADSAGQVAESANNALESATQGYDKMVSANETMNEIRDKVNLIAERIMNLNSVAQRIREITNLIDTISNETHLLALNAAIESAGAGEEGERFAVVAGHVRKLAQRSRVAAVEIQELVSQIQHAAASSVMATEEGTKAVARGERMVSESLQANENIIKQVGQTTQLAEAISQATQQQRLANTQAADTMRQLSTISSSISQNSQQYLQIATDLGEVVTQLNAVINAFVLDKEQLVRQEETDEDDFEYDENDLPILNFNTSSI